MVLSAQAHCVCTMLHMYIQFNGSNKTHLSACYIVQYMDDVRAVSQWSSLSSLPMKIK